MCDKWNLILILSAQWNSTENAFHLGRSSRGFCTSSVLTVAPFQCGHCSLLSDDPPEHLLTHLVQSSEHALHAMEWSVFHITQAPASISVTTCFWPTALLLCLNQNGRVIKERKVASRSENEERPRGSYMGERKEQVSSEIGKWFKRRGEGGTINLGVKSGYQESRKQETLGTAFGDLERDEITWTNGWIQKERGGGRGSFFLAKEVDGEHQEAAVMEQMTLSMISHRRLMMYSLPSLFAGWESDERCAAWRQIGSSLSYS